jgi:hypothetical protein
MFAAAEVRTAGLGGLKAVAKITGLARSTINRGENDLDSGPLPEGRVRRKGGGRKRVAASDPGLVPALKRLVEPAIYPTDLKLKRSPHLASGGREPAPV